jgi:hypothetical protein
LPNASFFWLLSEFDTESTSGRFVAEEDKVMEDDTCVIIIMPPAEPFL